MKRLFILVLGVFLLSGCVSWLLPPAQKSILRSEIENIPKAYELPETDPRSTHHFEVILHSEPEGAEVWSIYNGPKKIGNTPLAMPCIYVAKFTYTGCHTSYGPPEHIEKMYYPEVTRYEVWLKNILIKENGYFDSYVKKPLFISTSALDPNTLLPLDYFPNRSIEIRCSLVTLPDKFDKEIKKLTDENKFKNAERLRSERIVKLKELIENGGLQGEYVKELKRLKAMGNLTEPLKRRSEDSNEGTIKLKEDLDKAIKAGDYEYANRIKSLIEYEEKNRPDEFLKGINETAIKYNNEGLAYARQKYYADAVNSFKKAIEADPVYVYPYLNLSSCYINLGNTQEAISYAEKALELKPDSPVAFYYMGIAYDILGNRSLAVEKYQKALAECAVGECTEDFVVQIKKEGIQGSLFNSIQSARTRASKSASSQSFNFGDLLLGALLVGSSVDSGK